jgi:hypothetical protein
MYYETNRYNSPNLLQVWIIWHGCNACLICVIILQGVKNSLPSISIEHLDPT